MERVLEGTLGARAGGRVHAGVTHRRTRGEQCRCGRARELGGRGALWEMYNEPNISPFWRPKPNTDDYIKLALEVGTPWVLVPPHPGITSAMGLLATDMVYEYAATA